MPASALLGLLPHDLLFSILFAFSTLHLRLPMLVRPNCFRNGTAKCGALEGPSLNLRRSVVPHISIGAIDQLAEVFLAVHQS